MTDVGEKLSSELEQLRTMRDELRVRLHQGTIDAHELGQKAEEGLDELEAKVKQIAREAEEPLHDVAEDRQVVPAHQGAALTRGPAPPVESGK